MKLPVWFIICGIAGFVLYVANYQNAFPSTSLSFKVPREQIEKHAAELAKELNYTKKSTMQSTVFQSDNSTILFLQHHYGPKEADKLINDGLPCYYWSTRFCTPKQLEEFSCTSTPDGSLVSLSHRIPNDLNLPSLNQEKGNELILAFLKNHTNVQAERFKLLSFKSERKKTRDDLSFVFEDTVRDYKGARLRLEFGIGGNEITQFRRYLHVPDSWDLQYKIMRSYNVTINVLFWLFHNLMLAGAFLYLLNMLVLRTVRWKFAIRTAALLAFLNILSVLASAPNILHYYSTELPEITFAIALIALMLQMGASGFIGNVALFAPAEAIYRKLWGKGLLLEDLVSWKGISSAQFRFGTILGLATCGIGQGWQNLYYWSGSRFGVTCPLNIERPEILGSYAPFVSLIAIGSSASITEEIAYRVVFFLVAQKALGSFWLANFLQAFVWSLGHTGYPQSPFWARVAELTVSGVIDGMIFASFGVLPGIVGHYLFDSFLLMLFKASDWQLVLSGVIAIIPPFIFLLVSKFAAGKTRESTKDPVTADPEQVAADPEPESAEAREHAPPAADPDSAADPDAQAWERRLPAGTNTAEEQDPDHKSRLEAGAPRGDEAVQSSVWMSSKTGVISLISALLLVPACLVFFFLMKPDPLSLKLTGSEAEQIARDYVQKVGLNDPGLKICIRKLKTDTNDQANQCILDKLGKEKLRKTFEQVWSPQTWWIRFCGEQQIKEILVKVDASRKAVVGLTLKLPDSDAGARLSKEDALKKIGKFLQDYHSDLQPFKLVGSKSFEREHRSDHTTQWECTKTGIGCSDVKLRMECSTIGDVVSGYNPYWELPDKWSFSYQEITIRRGTAILGFLLQLLAAVILTIIWLLKVPKTSAPGFRYIVKFIAVVAGLSVLLKALMGSTLMANYDSQTPYLASVLQTICYQATENVPLLCMLGMAIVLASDAGAQFVPGDKNRADGENLPARLLNSEFLRTTISMGYSIGALAVFAFGSALHFVAEYSTEAVVNSYDLAAFLSEAYSPGTFAIVLALLAAILSVPILGVVYGFLKRFLDKPMPFYIMAAFLSFSIAGMTRHSHDVLLLGVLFFAGIAVLRCLIYKVFCGNPICLSVSVFVFVILGAVSQFLMLGRALLLSDAYICLASLVLFPAIAWIIGNRAREHAPPATH